MASIGCRCRRPDLAREGEGVWRLILDRATCEFFDTLESAPAGDEAREAHEWWRQFLAFVGRRQNLPHVPVVPTGMVVSDSGT